MANINYTRSNITKLHLVTPGTLFKVKTYGEEIFMKIKFSKEYCLTFLNEKCSGGIAVELKTGRIVTWSVADTLPVEIISEELTIKNEGF